MFYPISIFCFALLENPRPKKLYWQICLYYTICLLSIKFIVQLKIFNIINIHKQYSEFIQKLYNYKVGIKYFESGFGLEFFKYVSLDTFILLLLALNKNILISSGIWDRREEEIENIFLGSERFTIFKDLPSIKEGDQNFIFKISDSYYKPYIFERILKYNKSKEKRDTSKDKKIKEKNEEEDRIKIIRQKRIEEMSKIFCYDNFRGLPKYDESSKNYFNKLFPKIRNEKPGSDYYPFLAISLAIIIIYILLFFTQMTQDKTFGPVNLDTTQFSGNMVLFLILHIAVLVYDRILYVSQNKNGLKYKYFIYRKNESGVGLLIPKIIYNGIKNDYWIDKEKPFHFSPNLIEGLKIIIVICFIFRQKNLIVLYYKNIYYTYLQRLYVIFSHFFIFL